MIKLLNIIIENLMNIKVSKTNPNEFENILEFNYKYFSNLMSYEELNQYLKESINLNISFKSEFNNSIIGTILLGNKGINEYIENEVTLVKEIQNLEQYRELNGLEGVSFLIDEKYRGSGLDRKLLSPALSLMNQYDYTWAQVYKSLKTHNYWKRFGFKEAAIVNDGNEDIIIYIK